MSWLWDGGSPVVVQILGPYPSALFFSYLSQLSSSWLLEGNIAVSSIWLQVLIISTRNLGLCLVWGFFFFFFPLLGSLKSLLFCLHRPHRLCGRAAKWMVRLLWPTHCQSQPSGQIYHPHWKGNIHKSTYPYATPSQNAAWGQEILLS